MMSLALQDIIVAVAALGAVVLLAWRVFWPRRQASGKASCASCASGEPCSPAPEAAAEPEVRPLTLIRSKPGK
jgi:hypothetical protein